MAKVGGLIGTYAAFSQIDDMRGSGYEGDYYPPRRSFWRRFEQLDLAFSIYAFD